MTPAGVEVRELCLTDNQPRLMSRDEVGATEAIAGKVANREVGIGFPMFQNTIALPMPNELFLTKRMNARQFAKEMTWIVDALCFREIESVKKLPCARRIPTRSEFLRFKLVLQGCIRIRESR